MTLPIYVLNGPSLNLLGTREPEIYGHATLADIERLCATRAKVYGLETVFRQSNIEGVLVDWIQEAREKASALIINGAAYTHTSIAILDALRAFDKPVIEVHLSNPFRREPFRGHSYVSLGSTGVIVGLKEHGYVLAIDALANMLESTSNDRRRTN